MRLLFASFINNSSDSGMGRWTHRVAAELTRSGHRVELWFADDFKSFTAAGSIGRQLFPGALALRLLRRRDSLDVVILHEPIAFEYGLLYRYASSVPALVGLSYGVESRVFDEMLAAEREGLASVPLQRRLSHPLLRRWRSDGALRLAGTVVCASEIDRDYVRQELGVDPRKILVASSGADELPSVGVHGSLRVLAIGTWIQEKGSLALPKIWQRVTEAVPGARLKILGTGLRADQVLNCFPAELRASLDIIPSYTGIEELIQHARGASVYLLPSLREGSPLALLEAMALGLTPVASSVGGVPEILVGELRGLLYNRFDLDAAARLVTTFLREPQRAAGFASRARTRARELTWARTANVVENACSEALKSSKRALRAL